MSSTSPESTPGGTGTRVIAHRGASGYLPEHTVAAKAFAHALGADFIEQDVIASKDGRLVVLHDIYLDEVSDVAVRFGDRARDDGHFYTVDFTLDELKQLSLCERRLGRSEALRFPGRFPYADSEFRIAALDEEIRLIAGLNATTGRRVGLYPEIKDPEWHARHGIDLTALVHESLERSRALITGPLFLQSFDSSALMRLRDEFASTWPRVQLLGEGDVETLAEDPDGLSRIAAYAAGIGLPYQTLMRRHAGTGIVATPFARRLAESGLLVHPYTLRRDVPPPDGIDYGTVLRFLIRELRVDAIFCDHADDAIAVRDGTWA